MQNIDLYNMAEKKQNVLFEILNSLFSDKEYIENLTKESIRQNIFMINRRLAIKFPLQAQAFNKSKVNPVDVLKFWSSFLYNNSRPPGWIYTAGAVKSQAKKDAKKEISKSLINQYCNRYNISVKDIETSLKFFKEETIDELKNFEELNKQLKSYEENNY